MALTEMRTLGRVGAPKRGHGAPLEPLAQLGDALSGVGATASRIEAAELVVLETAAVGFGVGGEPCQGALTERRTLSGGGALETGDLSLLEDGRERGGALVSDAIARDTAKHGEGIGAVRG